METAEILHQFERFTGKFERAAVEAAVASREEVTPELLRILEETVLLISKILFARDDSCRERTELSECSLSRG